MCKNDIITVLTLCQCLDMILDMEVFMTTKRVTIAIEESLLKDLKHLAVERDIRLAELVNKALSKLIKESRPK